MSHFSAFPLDHLDDLLTLLPAPRRNEFRGLFQKVIGDLVWVADDAENAITAALEADGRPEVRAWGASRSVQAELLARLLEYEADDLIIAVQERLVDAASRLIEERFTTAG